MRPTIFFLSFGFLALVEKVATSSSRPRPATVYMNEFAVHVPEGNEVADEIAARHGFHNKGQVKNYQNSFFFIFFVKFPRNFHSIFFFLIWKDFRSLISAAKACELFALPHRACFFSGGFKGKNLSRF